MTGTNNPRFHLLVGWCCLMTSALLIMMVLLGTNWRKESAEEMKGNEKASSREINNKLLQIKGSGYSPAFNDYIRLIRDQKKKIWICDSCVNSSLSLNNDTVKISTTGLYHIHAQVIFDKVLQQKTQTMDVATVTLIKIQGLATKFRKLSEVMRFEPGTLTMIRLVSLKEGDSIRLDIRPEFLRLSNEEFHTYWEILLYNKNV